MPGYTHLQPAQPVTYGYYLAGIAQALERDFARLSQCRQRINISPLGTGAMAGTSFPIDRQGTARWLGWNYYRRRRSRQRPGGAWRRIFSS